MKTTLSVEARILMAPGKRVAMGADLAAICGVTPRALRQSVKRNGVRFAENFVLPLRPAVLNARGSQNVILDDGHGFEPAIATIRRGQHAKYRPHGCTEHDTLLAANVLHSKWPAPISVSIARAFVCLRKQVAAYTAIPRRLAEIDKSQWEHDTALRNFPKKRLPLLQRSATSTASRKRCTNFIDTQH